MKIVLNEKEIEFDPTDYVQAQKVLDCQAKINIETERIGKISSPVESLRETVKMYQNIFIDITGIDVLEGITSVNKATELFSRFADSVYKEANKLKLSYAKYDPKRIK